MGTKTAWDEVCERGNIEIVPDCKLCGSPLGDVSKDVERRIMPTRGPAKNKLIGFCDPCWDLLVEVCCKVVEWKGFLTGKFQKHGVTLEKIKTETVETKE